MWNKMNVYVKPTATDVVVLTERPQHAYENTVTSEKSHSITAWEVNMATLKCIGGLAIEHDRVRDFFSSFAK